MYIYIYINIYIWIHTCTCMTDFAFIWVSSAQTIFPQHPTMRNDKEILCMVYTYVYVYIYVYIYIRLISVSLNWILRTSFSSLFNTFSARVIVLSFDEDASCNASYGLASVSKIDEIICRWNHMKLYVSLANEHSETIFCRRNL